MKTIAYLLLVVAAVTVSSVGAVQLGPKKVAEHIVFAGTNPSKRPIVSTPLNEAGVEGDDVTLICEADVEPPLSRIQWWDYVTGSPRQISDNGLILPGHPNSGNMALNQPTPTMFHLQLFGAALEHGGTYACLDANGNPGDDGARGQAELIMLDQETNCTTYVPLDGIILEETDYSNQCIVTYAGGITPTFTWSGPDLSRNLTVDTGSQVFSGVVFTARREYTTQSYILDTNFTALPGAPSGVATNAPGLAFVHPFGQLFVYWSPKNMYYEPVQNYYTVGQTITCYADALPNPFYQWYDLGNLDQFPGQALVIPARMQDRTVQVRCRAQNLIQGFTFEGNFIFFIDVHDPPTTPPTTPAPSTTTAPLDAPCRDLTGWWNATSPDAELRLQLDDTEATSGNMIGFMRNNTDTFWVEVVGRTRLDDFAYIGITAIFPGTSGIVSMAGECHRCSGFEVLIINTIWRSIADSAFCGDGGNPRPDISLVLTRNLQVSPGNALHNLPKDFKVYQPTSQVTGRLLGEHMIDKVAHVI